MLEKPWSVALLISPIATTKHYNSWAYSRDVKWIEARKLMDVYEGLYFFIYLRVASIKWKPYRWVISSVT